VPEVVLVAIISAGSAVAVALMTQYLATRAADRQAGRQERLEQQRWQHTEASRVVERQRADLQALWAAVLETRHRISNQLDAGAVHRGSLSLEESASGAAARVYAVALVGLPGAREQARAFYDVVAKMEAAKTDEEALASSGAWGPAYRAIEEAVQQLADRLVVSSPPSH